MLLFKCNKTCYAHGLHIGFGCCKKPKHSFLLNSSIRVMIHRVVNTKTIDRHSDYASYKKGNLFVLVIANKHCPCQHFK